MELLIFTIGFVIVITISAIIVVLLIQSTLNKCPDCGIEVEVWTERKSVCPSCRRSYF